MHARDFVDARQDYSTEIISKNRSHTPLQGFFLEEWPRLKRSGSRQMRAESPPGAAPSPSSIAERSKSGRTAPTSRPIIRRTPSM